MQFIAREVQPAGVDRAFPNPPLHRGPAGFASAGRRIRADGDRFDGNTNTSLVRQLYGMIEFQSTVDDSGFESSIHRRTWPTPKLDLASNSNTAGNA